MSQPIFVHIFQELMVPLCALTAWAIVALFLWSIVSTLQVGTRHLRYLHQVPCDRCAFFTGNYQLKCTVHPLTALSEAASNCHDFEPAIPTWQIPRPSCPATKPDTIPVSAGYLVKGD